MQYEKYETFVNNSGKRFRKAQIHRGISLGWAELNVAENDDRRAALRQYIYPSGPFIRVFVRRGADLAAFASLFVGVVGLRLLLLSGARLVDGNGR